jgi:hypothetical protein
MQHASCRTALVMIVLRQGICMGSAVSKNPPFYAFIAAIGCIMA